MFELVNAHTGFARSAGESVNPHLWRGHLLGFVPCLGFAGRNVPDVSASRYDFAFTGTSSALSQIQSPVGPALNFAGNCALQQSAASWGLPCKILANSTDDMFMIQAVFKYTHSAAAKESVIFWSDNPTVGSHTYGYRLSVDNNADKLRLATMNDCDGIVRSDTLYKSTSTLTGGLWYHLVVVYDIALSGTSAYNACTFFLNGLVDFTALTGGFPGGVEHTGSHLSSQNARVGSCLGYTAPDIAVALVNVWKLRVGGISGDQIGFFANQLYNDPLAMYRRRRRSGAKAPRVVSIGGTALRRMNVVLAG